MTNLSYLSDLPYRGIFLLSLFSPGPVIHDRGHGGLEEAGTEVGNMVEEVTDQRATEVVNFATEVYLTGVCSKPCAFMIAIATFAKLPSLLKVFSAFEANF